MKKLLFILISVFICFSAKANNNIKKYPVFAKADGYFYWQSEHHNEFSTGTYCEGGSYLKNNKKFCKTRERKNGKKVVCKIKEENDFDDIMFCANGNWSELYHEKGDGTCLTYIYDELLDMPIEAKLGKVEKGTIIGWADSQEKTKPVIIFNGCEK
jgi:hypothetical protein